MARSRALDDTYHDRPTQTLNAMQVGMGIPRAKPREKEQEISALFSFDSDTRKNARCVMHWWLGILPRSTRHLPQPALHWLWSSPPSYPLTPSIS
jgi:hypothetical protein